MHPATSAKAVVVKGIRKEKQDELRKAVAYCKESNVRGYAAIANKICPSIKDPRTINKYLDGRDLEKSKREDSRIMTDEEEAILVRFLKNKSRALQGINRKETSLFIHDMLKVREHLNKRKKGGRGYKPITRSGKDFLMKKTE